MCKIVLYALYLATPQGQPVKLTPENLSHCTRAELATARTLARENGVRYRIIRRRE